MNNNQGRRRTRRVRQQRKQKNTQISRILLTICMMALVAVVSIGGTMAWLAVETQTVTNTFLHSDVNITLTEEGSTNGAQDFQIIPGVDLDKEPIVTVGKNSETSWVFVKVDEQKWPEAKETDGNTLKVRYEIAQGWEPLPNAEGVYYREVAKNTDEQKFDILKAIGEERKEIIVSKTLTKAEMVKIYEDGNPTLAFTAYIIQKEGFATAESAWTEVSNGTYTGNVGVVTPPTTP